MIKIQFLILNYNKNVTENDSIQDLQDLMQSGFDLAQRKSDRNLQNKLAHKKNYTHEDKRTIQNTPKNDSKQNYYDYMNPGHPSNNNNNLYNIKGINGKKTLNMYQKQRLGGGSSITQQTGKYSYNTDKFGNLDRIQQQKIAYYKSIQLSCLFQKLKQKSINENLKQFFQQKQKN
ncbi:hypothetical protein PPERSA_13097 [Pseudocohnilembus persalinus]|uniref:Uncharacterized protein n=1 Tax=Pseudocohnilembus persalinus TaxID=266149 RepID=A0A0V0QX32_PSEPJ|nr:hypothetical protein PPERSA_13097 [Pseudocohnilembus persalinus]|eukprot:KRX06618.1 hypothetical protein PPERSA_13097 [Pseudocohnilembus persalinus]